MTKDEHVAEVRAAAEHFLKVIGEAGDAGVSQAVILPMLLEIMQGAGIGLGLPGVGALSQLQTG